MLLTNCLAFSSRRHRSYRHTMNPVCPTDGPYIVDVGTTWSRTTLRKAPSSGVAVAARIAPTLQTGVDPPSCPECSTSTASVACCTNVDHRSLTRSAPDLLFTVSSRCPPMCSTTSQESQPPIPVNDFLLPGIEYDIDSDYEDSDVTAGLVRASISGTCYRGDSTDGQFGRTLNTPV